MTPDPELPPVALDMSAFVIAGAVASQQTDSQFATNARTPAQGVQDGVDAELLGFRRVWLSERMDIKNAEAILAGIAARTTRLEVGSGVIGPTTRHPWLLASFAATMQAAYGPRLVLGLGRGDNAYYRGTGIEMATYRQMDEYIDLMRGLWRGDSVDYDGSLGHYDAISFAQTYHGPPPPVWFGGFAQPKGAKLIAERCDGVLLVSMMTPHAVRDAVDRIERECERIGRDPAEIRKVALVVTAPDLDDLEARALAHGRMVTYLTYPGYGDLLARVNGWDPDVVEAVRSHPLIVQAAELPDRAFQRHELLEVAERIPDEYMADCSAIGSVEHCVTSLQRFIDAGADEIATYGSTPGQNGGLVAAWRERPGAELQPATAQAA